MTDDERKNRNPAPETYKTTRAEIEAMPEMFASELELHRVYALQCECEQTILTMNYYGTAIDPRDGKTLYLFSGPRIRFGCALFERAGFLYDDEGRKITVRKFTGPDA